ncbi:MAG: hypothetical protein HKM04_01185 [Legionellales bacterium]|nr:hypothetical protein [Legionellales bacterium]
MWKKTQVPFFSNEEEIEEKAQRNIDLKILVVRAKVSDPVKLDHYRWIENYTNASFSIPGVHYDYLTKKIHYTQSLIINAELYPCKAYQFDPAQSSRWPYAPFNSFYQGAHAAIIAFDTGLKNWEKNLSSLIEKVKSKIDVPIFLVEITANGLHQTVCNNEIKTLVNKHGCSSTGVVNFDSQYDVENTMENTIMTIIKAYLAKENYVEHERNDRSLIEFI